MYESNWKRISGLQMAPKVAELGYDIFKTLPKGKVLDIGCGDGANAIKLKKMGFNVEGCDISKNAVKKASYKGIFAVQVDVNSNKLPFKSSSYDIVWLTDVIEHVFWPEYLISEIFRILKPSGFLYLSTPNISWWGIRTQILFGKTLSDIHPEHIHWFTFCRLEKLLLAYKFKIDKEYGYNCLIPHPVVKRIPGFSKFNSIGQPHTLLSYTIAILATKK